MSFRDFFRFAPIVCFCFTLFPIPGAFSQDVVTLARLEGPIQLDGIVDEEAWMAVEPLPLTMYQPIHEGEMTEKTVIRVAYDSDYLYVGGQFYDADPAGIRANSLYSVPCID